MFGRDRQDQPVTDDSAQDNQTGAPVFVPEPEHLETEDTSMQESVEAVMSQPGPSEETAAPEQTTEAEPNFIMTSAPTGTTPPVDNDEPAEEPQAENNNDEKSNNFAVPVTVNGASKESSEDLSTIKSEALKSLAPLVDHIEQSPEEKFQTVMMMLEATNDPSLVKAAYEAAKAMTDEKAKSKALLEVVAKIDSLSK